jgi:hypothetical protein
MSSWSYEYSSIITFIIIIIIIDSTVSEDPAIYSFRVEGLTSQNTITLFH